MSRASRTRRRTTMRNQFYLVVWNGRILHSGFDRGVAGAFHAGLGIESAELIVGRHLLSPLPHTAMIGRD